jgi:hypothetical protein
MSESAERVASQLTFRYAFKCFRAPRTHGSNLVLSLTAVVRSPPASSPLVPGPEGKDLMRCKRVEK